MSKGAYTVDRRGDPVGQGPALRGLVRRDALLPGRDGEWAPAAAGDERPPGQPARRRASWPIDAVDALAAAQPTSRGPTTTSRTRATVDGDGNVFEPDGVIDHVVLVHAGEDKSGGGGAEGAYAIWAHSVGGRRRLHRPRHRPAGCRNYIVQPEDSGVGVFAHEYGHDLGLPDLYDTSGAADSDVDFWDLMSSGSHSRPDLPVDADAHGPLGQVGARLGRPASMLEPGASRARRRASARPSRTPQGHRRTASRSTCPTRSITLADAAQRQQHVVVQQRPGLGRRQADPRPRRARRRPTRSSGCGTTTSSRRTGTSASSRSRPTAAPPGPSRRSTTRPATVVSTDDGYADPNGRMADFGDKKYGLTGDTDGWRHDYVDLTRVRRQDRPAPAALRHRRGLRSSAAGSPTTSRSPTAAPPSGATTSRAATTAGRATVGTLHRHHRRGLAHRHRHARSTAQYYLAEWRNFDGFDEGLQYAYDTTYPPTTARGRSRRSSTTRPGMLVWYRDTTYGNVNHVTDNLDRAAEHRLEGRPAASSTRTSTRCAAPGDAAAQGPVDAEEPARRGRSRRTRRSACTPTYPFKECLRGAGEPFSEYCTTFGAAGGGVARSPTPRPGTRVSSCAAAACSTATSTPRWSSRRRATRRTPPGSSTPTAPRRPALRGRPRVRRARHRQPRRRRRRLQHHVQVVEVKSGNTAAKIHIVPPTP